MVVTFPLFCGEGWDRREEGWCGGDFIYVDQIWHILYHVYYITQVVSEVNGRFFLFTFDGLYILGVSFIFYVYKDVIIWSTTEQRGFY